MNSVMKNDGLEMPFLCIVLVSLLHAFFFQWCRNVFGKNGGDMTKIHRDDENKKQIDREKKVGSGNGTSHTQLNTKYYAMDPTASQQDR